MQEEFEQRRSAALVLCNRLLAALEENQDDAHSFFGGEVYQVYDSTTDIAKNKVKKIRNEIRNLS